MSSKLAFAHPGRMGDALYTLPTIKYVCEKEGVKADFWTSEYCAPLKDLFEYQDYIDKFYVSPSYRLENWGCGGQPPSVPIPDSDYIRTYQLGFRRTPDTRLDWFIGNSIGIDSSQLSRISYQYPPAIGQNNMIEVNSSKTLFIGSPYIVIAPRGETGYSQTFKNTAELALSKNIGVVYVGGKGDDNGWTGFDCTGLDFLPTLSIMSKAIGFVGLMSSQLVLANGFDMPKVAPHNNRSWDLRHVVYSPSNYYPIDPTPEEILEIIIENSNLG